ncbi:MAG: hypothetical protein MJA29_05780 [Candidatus Omnitrophica bacterium]|nr:hypothetical protein [Candidatus Omnitrophota bacterium]
MEADEYATAPSSFTVYYTSDGWLPGFDTSWYELHSDFGDDCVVEKTQIFLGLQEDGP